MTRSLLTLGLTALSSALAFGVIAPPVPRLTEWKVPDAPKQEPATPGVPEDPATILERVTQNAKAVGDRLKDQDTGDDTRKKQDQVLKDIDALLKQNENPPLSGGGGGGASDMPPPMGGGNSGMKPMGGMGGGSGQPMPMGGGKGGGQRLKRGGAGQPMPMPTGGMKEPMMQPGGGMGTGMKEPMPMGEPKGPGSNSGTNKTNQAPPTLPNEDPFTKQVWGHLPEKLRQQASQYYREQYMPKYQEMLKQYYSNLAERDRPARK